MMQAKMNQDGNFLGRAMALLTITVSLVYVARVSGIKVCPLRTGRPRCCMPAAPR